MAKSVRALRILAGLSGRRNALSAVRGVRVVSLPGGSEAPVRDAAPDEAGRIDVVAASQPWLRHSLNTSLAWVATRKASIVVQSWAPPQPGWSGRLGPLPGVLSHEITLPRRGFGRAEVRISLDKPLPLHMIVGAALGAFGPSRVMPAPLSADVATYGTPPAWLPAAVNTAGYVGPTPDDNAVRPFDVLLADAGQPTVPASVTQVQADPSGLSSTGGHVILVDASTTNPCGYQAPKVDAPDGVLALGPDGQWSITAAGGQASSVGQLGAPLDEQQIAALRELRSVAVVGLSGAQSHDEAALLAQIAMTGAVLNPESAPAATAELLAEELVEVFAEPAPEPTAPAIEWEIRSVRQRRAAMRHHASGMALPSVLGSLSGGLVYPSVSALLVTRRPTYLPAAIKALGSQSYPNLEIVLGLHGVEPTAEVEKALRDCGRPYEVVQIDAARSFGEALGEVTAQSRGTLVTKVDDDDLYGPEHVWDLVLARHYSGANVVGKGSEFVYLEQLGVTVRRSALKSESYVDLVAGGAMLLSRGDLEAVGGWRPLARSVDRGLLDRVQREGGLIYRTHPLGFIYRRHGDGHTWDPGLEHLPHRSGPQWSGLPPYAEFGVPLD